MNTTSNQTKTLLWGLAGLGAWALTKALLAQRRKIDFRDKAVIVTGGSRGLGLAISRQLAKEGARLALCARDADELARAKADLLTYGGMVFTYACDITDKAEVERFAEAARQEIGPIDVLINNAGIILVTPYEHSTEDDFRDAMDTNFWAPYHLINAVLPQMLARKSGRIVNVTSIGGKISVPHLLPYSASKFALVGYSEGLRAELLKDNIYVTTVCPGLTRTGSPRNAIFKGKNEDEYAWFKIADSLPLVTSSAEACAGEIIDACRYGEAERLVSWPTKVSAAVQGLSPNLVAELSAVTNEFLLPDKETDGSGGQRVAGKDSETALSDSALATLTDQAAVRNNELGD
ncbi:SDR family NAD(P)-dependent oxidoreductase [Spirosoma sp. KUDC1026]|uniref:SDR family NAD(P)-dependent oxidoreductase n=1 Tax=Spirosoma sp. KUDC1026 TaxID=2745947 RepID=UPI00159BB078|nr:SDR family oxidoreductase [Spirosoma sp. KUDC1026]QKZ12975.1 SDR family oxidoreductase [Spirosoma sp. KUDC1026]